MADPCADWCDADDLASCCPAGLVDAAEAFVPAVSGLLYTLSGQQFTGVCSTTVRPSRSSIINDGPINTIVDWPWHRFDGCACGFDPMYDGRTCGSSPVVDLGYAPLRTITAVTIDGAALSLPGNVRIDDRRWLVRTDGQGWPCCQDLAKPTSEPGTWSVAFTFGETVPAAGVPAAARWACEFARACDNDGADCSLPKRVQTLVRQGVTEVLLDPFQFLEQGSTALYEVDMFLSAYNPNRLIGGSVVVSPDRPVRTTETTWSAT